MLFVPHTAELLLALFSSPSLACHIFEHKINICCNNNKWMKGGCTSIRSLSTEGIKLQRGELPDWILVMDHIEPWDAHLIGRIIT